MRDDRRLNALARGRLRAQRSAAPRGPAVEPSAGLLGWPARVLDRAPTALPPPHLSRKGNG
jgi:hypothetical protein